MSQRIKITDFMAPELDVYARLTENQLLNRAHPEEGMFIAESPKVIERALDAGCIPVSLLMETKHVQGEAKEMIERCGDIPVYTAEFDVLTKLTGFALTSRPVQMPAEHLALVVSGANCRNRSRFVPKPDALQYSKTW